jgi:glycosyltransferase involved in cell wall biosynthesis
VIGATEKAREFLEEKRTSNLRIIGRLTHEELLPYYQRAKVYCQLSVYEAFGMALAEAMLCQCIPLGSNDGATPQVIGDVGFIIESRDTMEAAKTVRKALDSSESLGRLARRRIIEHFSIQQRENALRKVIDG